VTPRTPRTASFGVRSTVLPRQADVIAAADLDERFAGARFE
jgi:hypothetical protein